MRVYESVRQKSFGDFIRDGRSSLRERQLDFQMRNDRKRVSKEESDFAKEMTKRIMEEMNSSTKESGNH